MDVFEPEVINFIEVGQKLDFLELVQRLLVVQKKLAIYRDAT